MGNRLSPKFRLKFILVSRRNAPFRAGVLFIMIAKTEGVKESSVYYVMIIIINVNSHEKGCWGICVDLCSEHRDSKKAAGLDSSLVKTSIFFRSL